MATEATPQNAWVESYLQARAWASKLLCQRSRIHYFAF